MRKSKKSARGSGGEDERLMQKAMALAARGEGWTRPNPPVGAVVARHGRILGQGYHREAGGAHAEVIALDKAGAGARGATLYVTLEPCCTWGRTGPCTEAIVRQGIARVVVAARDPNPKHRGRGLRILRSAGIVVTEGICAEQGERLLAPFVKLQRRGLPFLTLKLGISLDGRIADRDGQSRWITGPEARRRVREMRHKADAIMIGRGTACADNPSLLVGEGDRGRLFRVIVDSAGTVPPDIRVLTDGLSGQTIVATTTRCPRGRRDAYAGGGASVWILPTKRRRVSLRQLLRRLGRAGMLHVLCEGGGELAASLVADGLVDEYAIFAAPMLLGGRGVPCVGGQGWLLKAAPRLRFTAVERLGGDVFFRARDAAVGTKRIGGKSVCSRA